MRDPAITPFDLIGPGWRHHVTQTRVGGRFVVRSNPLGAIWDAIKGICFPAKMEMDAGGGYAVDNPPDASSYFPATVGSYGFGGLYGGNAVLGPSGQAGQDCGPGTMWDPTLRQCVLQSAGMMTTPPPPVACGPGQRRDPTRGCVPCVTGTETDCVPCPTGMTFDGLREMCVSPMMPPSPSSMCPAGMHPDPNNPMACIPDQVNPPNPPDPGSGMSMMATGIVQIINSRTGPTQGAWQATQGGMIVQQGTAGSAFSLPQGVYVFTALSVDGKRGMTGAIGLYTQGLTVQIFVS